MAKVVHLWKSDSATQGGGGAVAMYRLHEALLNRGVESQVLCEHKGSNSSHVHVLAPKGRIERRLEGALGKVGSRLGLNDIQVLSSGRIRRHPAFRDAQIVNVHGTHHGFINYLALPSLTRHRKGVFVLHDYWAFTGHCAFSYGCERWRTGCGQCPHLDAVPAVRRDATAVEWRLKSWVFSRCDFAIVSPSSALAEQARDSMVGRFAIHHIPHGVDTSVYRPRDKRACKAKLGISPDTKVLMVGANSLNDFRKGGDLLVRALSGLPQGVRSKLTVVAMGHSGRGFASEIRNELIYIGFLQGDEEKANAYNAADLFVSSSRSETFGLVILESMACGTPTVAFAVGGVTDLVRHGETGYSARPEDADDLREGVLRLVQDDEERTRMAGRCREVVEREFGLPLQAKRYSDLYDNLLSPQPSRLDSELSPGRQPG